jgi:hypothetical protein
MARAPFCKVLEAELQSGFIVYNRTRKDVKKSIPIVLCEIQKSRLKGIRHAYEHRENP